MRAVFQNMIASEQNILADLTAAALAAGITQDQLNQAGSNAQAAAANDPITPAAGNGGDSVGWAIVAGGFWGSLQGVANTFNGVQDIGIGILNLPATLINGVATVEEWAGILPEGAIDVPYIPSPDWSNGLVTDEDPTLHGISKFLGGNGVVILVGAVLAGRPGGGTTPTIGQQVVSVSDDAIVNFGSRFRDIVQASTGPRSYWFRFGDIKHLTPIQLQTVIGDLAAAGAPGGLNAMRVAVGTVAFQRVGPPNMAGIFEYITNTAIRVAQNYPISGAL